jgi:hypothetical protein
LQFKLKLSTLKLGSRLWAGLFDLPMDFYLSLPIIFLRFWFIEAPISIITFFASLNKAFLQIFSLPLLIRTYFKPWKNEYREGLILFSIGVGIFIKTFVILVDLMLFIMLFLIEIFLTLLFVLFPFLLFLLFF